MFRFLGLRRALVVTGLAGLLAFGFASESSAQELYGGVYYAAPNGWVFYPVWPRFHRTFPFARRHHPHFGFGRGGSRWPRFARPSHPRGSRFPREPERPTIVQRLYVNRFRPAQPQRAVSPRPARAQPLARSGVRFRLAGIDRAPFRWRAAQIAVAPFAAPSALRLARGREGLSITQAPDLGRMSVGNRRPARGSSEQKPRIAAVPLPPRRFQIRPGGSGMHLAVADHTRRWSLDATGRAEPPSKGDQDASNGAQPAREDANGRGEGQTKDKAPSLVVEPSSASSMRPPSSQRAAVPPPADSADQKPDATDPKQPQPSFSRRSSAEDEAPADAQPEGRSLAGPVPGAKTKSKTPYAVEPTGTVVSVTFLPTATPPEILTFLDNYNLTIADGPSQEGSYRVRLSSIQLPKELVAQFVKSMRAQKKIVKNVTD